MSGDIHCSTQSHHRLLNQRQYESDKFQFAYEGIFHRAKLGVRDFLATQTEI